MRVLQSEIRPVAMTAATGPVLHRSHGEAGTTLLCPGLDRVFSQPLIFNQ